MSEPGQDEINCSYRGSCPALIDRDYTGVCPGNEALCGKVSELPAVLEEMKKIDSADNKHRGSVRVQLYRALDILKSRMMQERIDNGEQ